MNQKTKLYRDADFAKDDLSGMYFDDCCFYNCDFSNANLQDAIFQNCQFIEQGSTLGCRFNYADLREVKMQDCQLSHASFIGAHGLGLELIDCDLKGANFARARFANQISHRKFFCSVKITGCNLSYANFDRQCIEQCDLSDNRWIGCGLQSTSLQGSDLSRGVFSSDCWQSVNITNCDLSEAELNGLNPRHVDLCGVTISRWQQETLLAQLGLIVVD